MSSQTQNKVVTKPQTRKELKELLQGETFKRELGALLPRTMSPERFVRIAFQAIHRNPDLLKCSQESFFNCLLQLGAMGLEPDGRRAHLIPFGQECTLVVDYKGIKELVRRNHDVSAMHCDVVGVNDEFTLRFGTHGVLDHKPNLEDRGKILCAYSWVKLPDGNEEFEVMNLAEIETIRKRSRSPNKGPWVTDWNEMAKKTVFRRHSKGLPLSPETREALERDNDADSLTEQERFKAAAPAMGKVLGGNSATERPLSRTAGARQSELEMSASEDQGAPEDQGSVSDEPAQAGKLEPAETLQMMVRKRLEQDGYSELELVELLKRLKIAPSRAVNLEDCDDQRLTMVLQDWDTCTDRLKEARALGKAGAAA
jgi:recombination protein RecT